MRGFGYRFLFFCPMGAWAHAPESTTGGSGWWPSQTLILLNLLTLTLLFLLGCYRRKERSRSFALPRLRLWCFGGAIIALLVALVSPLDTYAGKLGWVHMIQHTTLMMVAAPLFILGTPGSFMLWALPGVWRRRLWRPQQWVQRFRLPYFSFSQPILIWLLFAFTLWVWHIPILYEGALRSQFLHDIQHLTFFLTACLFWQALLHPMARRRLNQGLGVLYLFLAMIHSTALGVLMAFSPVVWYPYYEDTTPALGYSPLTDQHLAGYIMWMPACMIYAAIAIALFASWLIGLRDKDSEKLEFNVQRI